MSMHGSCLFAATLLLAGCSVAPTATTATPPATTAPPSTPSTPAPAPTPTPAPSATGAATVFTMNNDPVANAVLGFQVQADGTLLQTGTYPTGGKGTGGGLGNQAALAFSTDKKLLYVVNAGSNDFTSFRIASTGLTLASRVGSGGARPVSVSEYNGTVYVLNLDSFSATSGFDSGFDSISGFKAASDGTLTPIPNSTRSLSATSTGAAQVAISPDGKVVMVAERSTAVLPVYSLDATGAPSTKPVLNLSNGTIPFGFQFLDATRVLVSEEGPNATSSYTVSPQGTLTTISRSVPAFQPAVCWLAITPDLRFAYTGNTSGRSVSGYSIATDGSLRLLVSSGLSASTDGGALDLTVSGDGKYLYVVLTGGSLQTFRINQNGGLTAVQTIPSLGALNGVIAL